MRRAHIAFDRPLHLWDGFGVNYVETCQTRDYAAQPQDYGGFSTLDADARAAICDRVFGPDGLRPGTAKMFLDPWHQADPDGPFDHETTTRWMRAFVREGLRRTRERGDDLSILTTLYGPPAWATRQRFVRGRDLDPAMADALVAYLVDWVRFLRDEEGLPCTAVSLHNEGEDWTRWPLDGRTPDHEGHDYNLYWPPEQVADFVKRTRAALDAAGLVDVAVAPGETSNWTRFLDWGYAPTLADDPESLAALGLITSHGFYNGTPGPWFGDWRRAGVELLQRQRPDLRAWVTSTSWGKMDAWFAAELRHSIYAVGASTIIPWACIQRSDDVWIGGDPNPGTAFRVDGRGGWRMEPGYHVYRQVSLAGPAGTTVCRAWANDPEVYPMAFGPGKLDAPKAFVLINTSGDAKPLDVELAGAARSRFRATRTGPGEAGAAVGFFEATGEGFRYEAPPGSVTTFEAD